MRVRALKLTKRTVDGIVPNGRDSVYWDGELTGFGLRVRASGRKNYVVQTRVGGRQRWFTLGPHGPLSADEARARALEILALAHRGIDPRGIDPRGIDPRGIDPRGGSNGGPAGASDRGAGPERPPAVSALGRRFLDEYVPVHCKPSTAAHYRRLVARFVEPALGGLAVAEVRRKDIAELHYAMRETPYQANRTLGMLSKMFALAEVWNWRPDGSNPCRHVRTYRERKRERFLSDAETARLGAVLCDLEDEMPSAVAAIRLLLLTGCRVSEIRDLRWEHVREGWIELPDSKTGGRIVPLGPEALGVLASIPREPGNPWVFVGRFPGTHRTDLQKPWRLVRKRAGLEDVRLHDLRHSFASRALALGESLTMIGRLLGHTQVQTTARYAHLARDSIRNAATRITGSIGPDLLPPAPRYAPLDAAPAGLARDEEGVGGPKISAHPSSSS